MFESISSELCVSLRILTQDYGMILLICCAFILIDLLTGLTKAKIQGKSIAILDIKDSGAKQRCWQL